MPKTGTHSSFGAYPFILSGKGAFYLQESKRTSEICRSIFKGGSTETTKRDYTEAWIHLINQLERSQTGVNIQKSDKIGEICYTISGNGLSHL